jgi:hypothetical protein
VLGESAEGATRLRTAPTGKNGRQHTGHTTHTALQTKTRKDRKHNELKPTKKNSNDRKRGPTQINTQQPIQDKRL